MKNVIFVAPYFMDATARFVAAAADTDDARLGLVSCDPVEKLDASIRGRLQAHYKVDSVATHHLMQGVQAIGRQFGSIDRVIGMLEQIQVPLGEIRDHLGIDGMGAQAAANFRDKARMKTVLQESDLPCARHQLVGNIQSGFDFAAQTGYPLVVKPPAGAGAKGTYRCENDESLRDCLQSLHPSGENPILLEEFIVGEEHSFDSVCIDDKLVWHSISHYFPGPLEVVQQPWIQWCVMLPRSLDAPRHHRIRQIAEPALQALGIGTGLSHMEWFLRPNGSIAISEVGARPPGAQITTLLSYAHDIDMYRAWAKLMIHSRFDPPERKYACGAAYLRGMGHGRVAHVHGLEAIGQELGSIVVEAKIPEAGQHPSGSYEGEGHIIVRHEDTGVVEEALMRIITSVQVQLADQVHA